MKVPKEQDAQPALDKIVENGHFPSWTPDGRGLLYVHSTFRNTRIARPAARKGDGLLGSSRPLY